MQAEINSNTAAGDWPGVWECPDDWEPLDPAVITWGSHRQARADIIRRYRDDPEFREALPGGVSLPDILIDLRQNWMSEDREVWMNGLYQVIKTSKEFPAGPGWHLSIKRLDREPITDWRHLQLIKNQLLGPEVEAVQLHPAESRLVDSANQYHLWALQSPRYQFPFGFPAGFKMNGSLGNSRQRDLDKHN